MTELVEAVRSTGARQPLMLGGLNWSSDLRGWLAHRPPDPAHALVASNHTYDFHPCDRTCRDALTRIAKRFPIITGELGEGDCRHGYIDPYMRWADRHGVLPRLGLVHRSRLDLRGRPDADQRLRGHADPIRDRPA